MDKCQCTWVDSLQGGVACSRSELENNRTRSQIQVIILYSKSIVSFFKLHLTKYLLHRQVVQKQLEKGYLKWNIIYLYLKIFPIINLPINLRNNIYWTIILHQPLCPDTRQRLRHQWTMNSRHWFTKPGP